MFETNMFVSEKGFPIGIKNELMPVFAAGSRRGGRRSLSDSPAPDEYE
jgi:hypothetical protein